LALLPIRTFPDPVLRERAREIEEITATHRHLVEDMLETMREAPGVGLAAPQVGVLERIFVWEVDGASGVIINPRIVERSEAEIEEEEGCLSLPGLAYEVVRAAQVKVTGVDLEGQEQTLEGEDLLARVFQHEIDHLDGVLFIDKLGSEPRREALARLREQALGLPPLPGVLGGSDVPPEETL
jgi:peptide deformylase